MRRGGRAKTAVVRKKKVVSGGGGGGGGSGTYSETFDSGTGGFAGGHWTGGQTVDNTRLSNVGGKLRLTGDATHSFPHAIKSLGQWQSGTSISLITDYAASAGAIPLIGLSVNADGSSTFLDSGNLTAGSSGTYTSAVGTVPVGNPTVYLVLYDSNNSTGTETIDFDNILISYTPYTGGGGGGGGTPETGFRFISSKYPTSFAGRAGETKRMHVATSEPATITMLSGLDAAEHTLANNGVGLVLSHPTGATGKTCTLQAVRTSDNATITQTVVWKQHPAIATATGLATHIGIPGYQTDWRVDNLDLANSDFWGVWGVKPDVNGVMESDSAKYWGAGVSWAQNFVNAIHTAGKKALVVFGGGGFYGEIYAALSDDTKRAALANALVAHCEAINVDGAVLDIEKNGSSITDQEWLWYADFSRIVREAHPEWYLGMDHSGVAQLKGQDPFALGSSNHDLFPAFHSHLSWIELMTYIQFGMESTSNTCYYNSPVRGAQYWFQRCDLTTTIDQLESINIFKEKLMVGAGGFVSWVQGINGNNPPTAPRQFCRLDNIYFPHSTDIHNERDWVEPGGQFATNLTKHYDFWSKSSWGNISPPSTGMSDPGYDNTGYLTWERDKDYADRRQFCLDKGLLGCLYFTPHHVGTNALMAQFHNAFATTATAATSEPDYLTGTTLFNETFPTNGNPPAGWDGFAGTAGTTWDGPNPAHIQVVSGRMTLNSSTSPVRNYPTAYRTITGLPQYQLAAVVMDVQTDANAEGFLNIITGSGIQSDSFNIPKNLNTTNYVAGVMQIMETTMQIGVGNGTSGIASSMSIDNVRLIQFVWDSVG
jgi:hypothetical protein